MAIVWDWVPAEYIEAMRGDHQLGVFFRLDTDPPARVWAGVGDVPAGIDAIDPDGTIYLGAGRLVGVPSLEVLLMGIAEQAEITLSGVDVATGTSVFAALPSVRGKEMTVGIVPLDQYYQPLGPIVRMWSGMASHYRRTIPVQNGRGPRTMMVGVVGVGGATGRSRPSRRFWSAAHHRAIYPTDAGCDGTARLGRGYALDWPRYS